MFIWTSTVDLRTAEFESYFKFAVFIYLFIYLFDQPQLL